ncbi:MAG: DNA double-strand break repair nuclease NurA [Methanothrix sp.]|nr:DNA double-strand break repair nuclease NurA [Methanothrix sp.]
MIDKTSLGAIAEQVKNYLLMDNITQYFEETGVKDIDFKKIILHDKFEGNIYAVDGSNGVIFDLTSVSFNLIRAGYVSYIGKKWQKTVLFDKVFKADTEHYMYQFENDLRNNFDINSSFILAKTELDRLSTYYRELQEYVALYEAISEAETGDLVLYDGDFAYWTDPFREVLKIIFDKAEDKDLDLLAISKSSTFSWGKGFSKPFVLHTGYAGSRIIPNNPWYIELSGKNIKPKPKGKNWKGKIYVIKLHPDSEFVFRLDAPPHVASRIDKALGHLSMYSSSSECLGYPHALFRAHRDLSIKDLERVHLNNLLIDELSDKGVNDKHIRSSLDYHTILEMKQGRRII